jgi:anaerobic selenocysteine-containing dehydrogenase
MSTNASHHNACILCSRNCGLLIETEGGQIKKIQGDPATPSSKGYLCQKAARLAHYQSHPDRLQQPLKRRPDGSFEAVSWDQALDEIAAKLKAIRTQHGGGAFAAYGGGGQGNHLGGAYMRQLLKAMGSRYLYTALGQEKTGDFWVNGRLFGKQTCHTTEDIEHADFVLVIGANPYQAHGIPNARDTLKHLHNDSARTLVVIDPRQTDTAKLADIHLALRPGTDAYLLAALLAIIVTEDLHNKTFIAEHCTGFAVVEAVLRKLPIETYVQIAGLELALVQQVARGFARAKSACVRADLGLQQTINSTLNSYLEKLLFLITGHFGQQGGNNLHTYLLPLLSDSDERKPGMVRTARHNMFPIAGLYPPNLLADEINHEGENRIRALWIDSGNPANSVADTAALEAAFAKLELLVVVDVAMTESASMAHYILPAASQFEKVECTGFNLEFPENYFHLRAPLFEPLGQSLPEAEIYTRLLEKIGAMPRATGLLRAVARRSNPNGNFKPLLTVLAAHLALRPKWLPYAASLLYRSLQPSLGTLAPAAVLLPLALGYAREHAAALRSAGHADGAALFRAILQNPQGIVLSRHQREAMWGLIQTPDRKIHLQIDPLLAELATLPAALPGVLDDNFPLLLMAGERRIYNANQIVRAPGWRKQDPDGALRIHPDDAARYSLSHGARARCSTRYGSLEVTVDCDPRARIGFASLPHGYGMRFDSSAPIGPQLNRLTGREHCDPFTRTPYHKHVAVRVEPV